jgi:hypothetical protein
MFNRLIIWLYYNFSAYRAFDHKFLENRRNKRIIENCTDERQKAIYEKYYSQPNLGPDVTLDF